MSKLQLIMLQPLSVLHLWQLQLKFLIEACKKPALSLAFLAMPWTVVHQTAGGQELQAHFSQMIPGSWKVTAQSGTHMIHTWRWGPGKHSIERWTEGESAAGQPWRELMVYYWHPQQKKIRLLGFSPFASGISQGTISFDGQAAFSNVELTQTGYVRQIGIEWQFDGSDRYNETLLEKDASGEFFELVSVDHVRTGPAEPGNPDASDQSLIMQEVFKPLEYLLGDAWKAEREAALNQNLETTITWIPRANVLYGQVHSSKNQEYADHLFNIYVYHLTGNDLLRCLALSDSAVYEGEIHVLKPGSIQLNLRSFTDDSTRSQSVQLITTEGDRIQQKIWSTEDTDLPASLEINHRRLDR